jgi:hypothetical protein
MHPQLDRGEESVQRGELDAIGLDTDDFHQWVACEETQTPSQTMQEVTVTMWPSAATVSAYPPRSRNAGIQNSVNNPGLEAILHGGTKDNGTWRSTQDDGIVAFLVACGVGRQQNCVLRHRVGMVRRHRCVNVDR